MTTPKDRADFLELHPISRKEALELGLNRYYTGKPCSYGHLTERRVDNYGCITCVANSVFKYSSNNKNKVKQRKKAYRDANKDRLNAKHAVWYVKNKQKIKAYLDKNRAKISEQLKASNARRRARKLKATAKWADLEKIKEIYKNCPKGMHVDHEIPLQGKDVCGLHVETNLQYLTPTENTKKGNKFNVGSHKN